MSYNRTHIRNAYIYIYILTQSFWTGTKVIRRKHIIQPTDFAACSSTCCQWDGEDVPALWEQSNSHPPVRQDMGLGGLGMANSKSNDYNFFNSGSVLVFLQWSQCWFHEIRISFMYSSISLGLNQLLNVNQWLQICIKDSCQWVYVMIKGLFGLLVHSFISLIATVACYPTETSMCVLVTQ